MGVGEVVDAELHGWPPLSSIDPATPGSAARTVPTRLAWEKAGARRGPQPNDAARVAAGPERVKGPPPADPPQPPAPKRSVSRVPSLRRAAARLLRRSHVPGIQRCRARVKTKPSRPQTARVGSAAPAM